MTLRSTKMIIRVYIALRIPHEQVEQKLLKRPTRVLAAEMRPNGRGISSRSTIDSTRACHVTPTEPAQTVRPTWCGVHASHRSSEPG